MDRRLNWNVVTIMLLAVAGCSRSDTSGNSAAFKEFSWRFTNLVAQGQVALGRVPTYEGILRDITNIEPLFVQYAQLVLKREHAAGRLRGWEDRLAQLEALAEAKKLTAPRSMQDRLPAVVAIAAFLAAAVLVYAGRSGLAFAFTAVGILSLVITLFTALYPRVMVSNPDFANSLTVPGTASAHYTLAVMSVVALIVTPLVLLYQGWTYYVFRARVTGEEVRAPAELLEAGTDAVVDEPSSPPATT